MQNYREPMSGVPVISVEQMREWERATWAAGVKASDVILQVGQAIARRMQELAAPAERILFLAGAGHNGDDARAAVAALGEQRAMLVDVPEPGRGLADFAAALKSEPSWIVDGLFGIGLNRPLDSDWRALIDAVNAASLPVLAVDTPSGLNAATGRPEGAAVNATITLTVGAPKRGLIGAPCVGRLEVAANVGLILCPHESELRWTLPQDFKGLPPRRAVESHKGTYGHAALIAGSLGYHGAAVLATQGALRAQPGLVSVYPQASVWGAVAAQTQAAMPHPWEPGKQLPPTCSAALFGPGLAGPDAPDALKNEIRVLWKTSALAMVVDATALAWLEVGATPNGAARVITPHPGEAGRLLDRSAGDVQRDRPAALRELSRKFGDCIVVLKGNQTLVGRAEGPIFINSSGNPHLAQGGSGDLLGGYITGLLAQSEWRRDALRAVRFAVWQHGAGADHLNDRQSNWTVEDLTRYLGNVKTG